MRARPWPRSTAATREAAFLLRPTRIEDVWEIAQRGDVMPQKSTFFYPKLTSGLLLCSLPALERTDWLEVCRASVGDVQRVLERVADAQRA